jgi:hypothetical protein
VSVHVQDEAWFAGPYQACYLRVQLIYSNRVHAHAKNVDPTSTRPYMWRHRTSSSSEKRASHEFLRASSMRARLFSSVSRRCRFRRT